MGYSHKKIERFSLEGEIFDDSHIVRLKDQYISMLINGMRNKRHNNRRIKYLLIPILDQ